MCTSKTSPNGRPQSSLLDDILEDYKAKVGLEDLGTDGKSLGFFFASWPGTENLVKALQQLHNLLLHS